MSILQNPPLKSSGQRAETWIEAAGISGGAVVFAFCAGAIRRELCRRKIRSGIFQGIFQVQRVNRRAVSRCQGRRVTGAVRETRRQHA